MKQENIISKCLPVTYWHKTLKIQTFYICSFTLLRLANTFKKKCHKEMNWYIFLTQQLIEETLALAASNRVISEHCVVHFWTQKFNNLIFLHFYLKGEIPRNPEIPKSFRLVESSLDYGLIRTDKINDLSCCEIWNHHVVDRAWNLKKATYILKLGIFYYGWTCRKLSRSWIFYCKSSLCVTTDFQTQICRTLKLS